MKKTEKGVVVRKVEPRPVVKPTKAVVPRAVAPTTSAAADPVPPLPPALARALAHAAEPRAPARAPVQPVAATTSDSLSAVKVFWATFGETRNAMGERITDWLGRHPELVVLDRKVTQSADRGFHCLTVTLFLGGDPTRYLSEPPEQRW